MCEIKKCSICGATENETRVWKPSYWNDYLCSRHDRQYRTHGKFLDDNIIHKKGNNYIFCGDHYKVELTDRKNKIVGYALIDIEDKEKCENYTWKLKIDKTTTDYVNSKECSSMHRFILGYNGNLQVDHINGNGLDNRKQNLRIVESTINNLNRQNAKGVKWQNNSFMACFKAYGKQYILGYYSSEKEAQSVCKICKKKFIENRDEFLQEYNIIKQIDDLDRAIHKTKKGQYYVAIKRNKLLFYVGLYNTIEEARKNRDEILEKIKLNKNNIEQFHKQYVEEKKKDTFLTGIQETKNKTWRVRISIKNKTKYIGTYKTLEEAIIARGDALKLRTAC